MTTDAVPNLWEALTKFVAVKKNGKGAQLDHHELGRFVVWCGRERNVVEVTPSEVADYAQYVGLGGLESAQRLNPVKAFLGYWKDEGWIQNGLAAHLRIPRGRRGSGKRVGTYRSEKGSMLSQEGYDRLVAQLDVLKIERGSVVEDIRQAMMDKDFRENAPLDAAKERQAIIESRIRELESAITNAQIMGSEPIKPVKRSTLGAKVTLQILDTGKKLAYTLVDVREADVSSGKISTSSPVGQALMDRAVGDEVTVTVPRGTMRYVIKAIDA